jgi:hypothetical protein
MKILLLSLMLIISSVVSYGQNGLLKTIGGAAKNKVEQQDFNSTRTNKEKLDNEDRPKSSPAPAPSSRSAEPAVDSAEIKTPANVKGGSYEDSYTFSQQLTYQMEDLQNPKKEKINMTYFYSENAIMSLTPEHDMSMIFDFTHESMIMLNEKEKSAIVMSSKMMQGAAARQTEKAGDVSVTKTGKTKKILGYNCEEYLIQSEKNKSLVWITTEIGIDYAKASRAMGGQKGSATGSADFDGKGLMMEMTGFDKKGVEETHMIMTEYKEESTTKSLSAYTITAM